MVEMQVLRGHILDQGQQLLVLRYVRCAAQLEHQALVRRDLRARIPHGFNPESPIVQAH
jgi:hypothetical protein